jgi:hypothetical protein
MLIYFSLVSVLPEKQFFEVVKKNPFIVSMTPLKERKADL